MVERSLLSITAFAALGGFLYGCASALAGRNGSTLRRLAQPCLLRVNSQS